LTAVTDDLTPEELATAERIRPHLRRGALVAVADGAGAPSGLGRPLAHAARQVGGVRLLLGWSFELPVPLDASAFPDVRAIVGGYGLRRKFGGHVHYVPARLSAVPALLHSVLRPDVLLAGLRPGQGGLVFGSEVGWARAAVDAGATVLAEVNHGLPTATREPALRDVTVVAETHRAPLTLPLPAVDEVSRAIGKHVAALVPAGAGVQFGPGGVGDAALRALEVPVRVDSGIVGDAVIDLAARGLLVGTPLATYLAGTSAVYEWADGRPILARVEHTHDPSRLSGQPLVAVNTALEVDPTGQVNVEGFAGDVVAGVGGHADFAGAAVRSLAGLSVVALPTVRGGRRTLVERLGAPTSTSRSDVDVVVTEFGVADLRGLDDRERTAALRAVWDD
jgi:acyl-CoA hydrolase